MIIEKLKEDDVKKTSNFFSKTFDEMKNIIPEKALSTFKFENSEEEIRRLMKRKNRIYLIAKEEDNIVGVIQGYHYGYVFYIVWVLVEKEKRGKGIGKALIKKIEDEASKTCHKVQLTSASIFEAIDFYRKNGYIIEGFSKNGWWNLDHYYLGKIINVG